MCLRWLSSNTNGPRDSMLFVHSRSKGQRSSRPKILRTVCMCVCVWVFQIIGKMRFSANRSKIAIASVCSFDVKVFACTFCLTWFMHVIHKCDLIFVWLYDDDNTHTNKTVLLLHILILTWFKRARECVSSQLLNVPRTHTHTNTPKGRPLHATTAKSARI